MMTSTLHLTMENVVRLAEKIVAKYGIPMQDAMDLAEFNLRYAKSYREAEARL